MEVKVGNKAEKVQVFSFLQNFEQRTYKCPIHGEVLVQYCKALGKPLECPYCRETEEAAARQRREDEKYIELVKTIGIRDRHFYASFENYYPPNAKAQEMLKQVYIIACNPKQQIVLLYGTSGTGKSHLASAAAIVNKGIYTTYEFLSMEIRASYAARAKKTENELMQYYCTVPFLVIDEIDKGKNEEAKKTLLSHICRERYERNRPIWLAGNCNYEWVTQMLDSSVIDRMKQAGTSFCFDWESYRPKLRQAE